MGQLLKQFKQLLSRTEETQGEHEEIGFDWSKISSRKFFHFPEGGGGARIIAYFSYFTNELHIFVYCGTRNQGAVCCSAVN